MWIDDDGLFIADPEDIHPMEMMITGLRQHKGDLVRQSLDMGFDVNARFMDDGKSALSYCASHGYLSLGEYLIDRGAIVDRCSPKTLTPMIHAIVAGHLDFVRMLIDRGADVTLPSQFGLTPLHWCAEGDQVEIAKLLVERGADPTATTTEPPLETPYDLAVRDESHAVAEYLRAEVERRALNALRVAARASPKRIRRT